MIDSFKDGNYTIELTDRIENTHYELTIGSDNLKTAYLVRMRRDDELIGIVAFERLAMARIAFELMIIAYQAGKGQ